MKKEIGFIENKRCEKDYCRKFGKVYLIPDGKKLIKLCEDCKNKELN